MLMNHLGYGSIYGIYIYGNIVIGYTYYSYIKYLLYLILKLL